MLVTRRCLRAAAAGSARFQRRAINYGHDMHKVRLGESVCGCVPIYVLPPNARALSWQEMLNGTAKVSVTDYDEGGFVVNDINLRGGVALYPEIAMVASLLLRALWCGREC